MNVSMNGDEEADADDLASEDETDRTRQNIRRNLQNLDEDCRRGYS